MTAQRFLYIIIFVIALCGQAIAQQASNNQSVWTWSQSCPPGKQLRIEALLNGKIIFREAITICRMERSVIPPEKPQRILEFFFKDPGAVFDEERSKAGNQKLEGNIWEAGIETDRLLLGVSVVGDNTILLNSIHVAKTNSVSQSKFSGGLIIKSTPLEPVHDSR